MDYPPTPLQKKKKTLDLSLTFAIAMYFMSCETGFRLKSFQDKMKIFLKK